MFVRVCCDQKYDPRGAAEGLVHGCLHSKPTTEDVKYLADEISQCPVQARIDIMRDHTNLDWRDLLPLISVPALVCVGRKSAVFDWQGSAYVGEKIPGAKTEFFENAGHMLFWEEPEHFNKAISDFVLSVNQK
jgi:pimeloyl-ACP methyl ester carboxylesterase